MRRNLLICLLLAGITFALYWPVRNFDLVQYDDPAFLTENAEIRSGLTGHSLRWAMTGVVAANWHPATNLSFILGHQLWGTNPGAEHLVNAVFHALNAVLLFLVLVRLTRFPWRSAVVAALFAWHPLRVESVAWIAERKDVLSVFFFFLTLLAWARYAQGTENRERGGKTSNSDKSRANIQHPTSNAQWYFWAAVLFFALGLMSKAMLVTLPFVLLLLDVWPLGRVAEFGVRSSELKKKNIPRPSTVLSSIALARRRINHLLIEKWPFFALTAAFSVITFVVQRGEAATPSLAQLGLGLRLENVIASYVRYLAWTVWPANLAAYYSFPFDSHFYLALWLDWVVGAAAVLLAGISAFCLSQIVRRPYLAVGWFWYLGTMVPVIGLVQVGGQGMADRYTYIPLIGPAISLVWLVAEKWPAKIFSRIMLSILTAAILTGCLIQTRHQLQFWKNTESLSRHTIEVTGENPRAEYILGLGLEHKGDITGAMVHYRNAMTSQPTVTEAFYGMGRLLSQQGRWMEAEQTYAAMLGNNPEDFTCHLGLVSVLPHLGRTAEAVTHLKAAMQFCPDTPDALNNLAWTLATGAEVELRDGEQAVKHAERACELTHYRETMMVGTLAAAYAEAGRFEEAVATAQKACALATESSQPELLARNQELLELYRQHQPYRELAKP
jgi:tetratricopeptide (TPR) repeat protein